MKTTRRSIIWIAVYTVIFITSLLLGREAGGAARSVLAFGEQSLPPAVHGQIKRSAPLDAQPVKITPIPTEIPPTQPELKAPRKQRNILVIGVDDLLAPQPELKSVWMVLFLNDSPHLMLVPIYPTRTIEVSGSSTRFEKLASLFSLDPESAPAPEFLKALEQMDLWWTGYLLVDQSALAQAMALTSADIQAGSAFELNTSFSGQVRLAQEMCRQSAWLSTASAQQILDAAAQIYPHMHTDLDLEQVVSEIKNAIQLGGGVSCEFPTLLADASQP